MDTNSVLFVGSITLSLVTLGVSIYAIKSIQTLRKLRENMGPEHQPENLEDILSAMINKIKGLEKVHADMSTDLQLTTAQTSLAVKKVGLVKFNSFADEGGNLSFSLAILDSDNNGVVLTSMHGRQQNRIYAKAVRQSVGEVPLNEEEQQAVMLAVTEHKNQTQRTSEN